MTEMEHIAQHDAEGVEPPELWIDDSQEPLDSLDPEDAALYYETPTHAETGHTEKEGMPQLKFETYPSQVFWLVVTFTVLYVLMSRTVIPRIRDVLEKRQTQITHDIDAAEQARSEAEAAKVAYEKEQVAAREKANQLLQTAQNDISDMVAAENSKLDKKLADEMAKAEAAIKKQTEASRKEVKPIVAELSGQIVEQLLNVKPAPKKLEAAVAAEMEKSS